MADSQRKTANLFDKSKRTNNRRVAYTTGEISELYSVFVSDFIPIEPNTTYTLNIVSSISNKTGHLFALYDENKNFVNTGAHEATSVTVYTFTTPSNVAYIRFNGNMASVDSIMLNEGSTALPYEPYGWVHSLRKLGTSTDTITTLPVDLYPNDTTATVGLKGNMEQSGTPTPDNPIQPSECGDRTGNLLDKSAFTGVGATIEQIKDGIRIITPSNGYAAVIVLDVLQNTDYSLSYIWKYISGNSANTIRVFAGTGSSTQIAIFAYSNGGTFNTGNNTKINIWFYAAFSAAATVEYTNIMLNTGSQPLPYEPFGVKIPISSASTTTPVYLGEVQSTRKIKKLVLTGQESLDIVNSCFILWFYDAGYPNPKQELIYCTHYQGRTPTYRDSLADGQCMIAINQNQITIKDLTYATVADFKAYLAAQYAAGTPVTIWYILATETTGILNEPLRKIGNYADTVSGITIPTTTGKDTFDVLTTLRPSEVELTYTGWHDASVKEWDGSEWGLRSNYA